MDTDSTAIDFWFSIGSTYSYLSVSRLPEVQVRSGVRFRWRPFNVRAIMIAMNNIPFATKPVKAAYMWRDIERRAAGYGLPFAGRPPYPIKALERANRIALVAAQEDWVVAFAQHTYRKWFLRHEDPVDERSIVHDLEALGQNPARVIALADAPQTIAALDAQTRAARALGIFGSPTFVVGDEIFWGDDRLADALAWHRDRGGRSAGGA
jgi:2-hydroxychromene-2-carboxylate isomerase